MGERNHSPLPAQIPGSGSLTRNQPGVERIPPAGKPHLAPPTSSAWEPDPPLAWLTVVAQLLAEHPGATRGLADFSCPTCDKVGDRQRLDRRIGGRVHVGLGISSWLRSSLAAAEPGERAGLMLT